MCRERFGMDTYVVHYDCAWLIMELCLFQHNIINLQKNRILVTPCLFVWYGSLLQPSMLLIDQLLSDSFCDDGVKRQQ